MMLTIMASSRDVLLIIAIAATAIAALQIILTLSGFGMDADVDADFDADGDYDGGSDSGLFTGFFSFRNVISFLAMFGWMGLYCIAANIGDPWAFLLSGFVATAFTVALQAMFVMVTRLKVDSTARTESAIGSIAEVYIPIPAQGGGTGRVFVTLNGSKRELSAISNGIQFPRGNRVKVIAVENGNLVVQAETVTAQTLVP
ncbi:MAG: hypothetical protein ACI959_000134 [Limisphaerales bacterium]|jgi:membrane protein implicated in regulation of membrane protease activity